MLKLKMEITPHPDRVLIKISKAAWDELFYKKIKRDDGEEVTLFTELEAGEGYDKRFTQNVSVGAIIAVGANVKNVYLSDLAIIDYLVSNNEDYTIGYVNGDKIVSILAKTTYHTKDAKPFNDGRKAYVKGDYDEVSPLLGVVRKKQVIAFPPYVFLNFKSNLIARVLPNGQVVKSVEQISKREILSAGENSPFKDGDEILLKEDSMFSRHISNKEISLIFDTDVLCKTGKP